MTSTEGAVRVEPRTVDLDLPDPFTGWHATWRTDFPARYLDDMAQAENWPAVCRVLDRWLVVSHNFPDADGNVAGSMLDVMPVEGVAAAITAFHKATGKLPNP